MFEDGIVVASGEVGVAAGSFAVRIGNIQTAAY
jgi:hypothetical protein